jgi:hypothetical protein
MLQGKLGDCGLSECQVVIESVWIYLRLGYIDSLLIDLHLTLLFGQLFGVESISQSANLTDENHEVTSPKTIEYNCIAWAANNSTRWWQHRSVLGVRVSLSEGRSAAPACAGASKEPRPCSPTEPPTEPPA